MLLRTINFLPGVRYRLLIGLWMNFIVFNCQVVEWVLIFANPVSKSPGINTYMVYLVKQVDELFCLLYKNTNNEVFDDFPKISDHFPKILQKLSKGHTNISEIFLNISEDYRGFTKD